VEDGRIENLYRIQIMNAAESKQQYRVSVDGLQDMQLSQPVEVELGSAEAKWVTVGVQIPPERAASAGAGMYPIFFDVQRVAADGGAPITVREKSTFMIPR
jgi:polyferredoxin